MRDHGALWANAVVTVRANGKPVLDADLLVLFPNGTWKRAKSDASGEALVSLHSTHLPMTVYAAAAGFTASVEKAWVPSEPSPWSLMKYQTVEALSCPKQPATFPACRDV